MANQKKLIIVAVIIIAVLVTALLLLMKELKPTEESKGESNVFYLLEHDMMDVSYVAVNNESGFYDVTQKDGGFMVYDIPADLLNTDYLQLLLDECSMIAVSETVSENPKDLSIYGLDHPNATVDVDYTDGTSTKILVGNEEALSDGVYAQLAGDNAVYLMPRANTIRYTMPIENYIQYQITPTRRMPSALSVVRDVSFSGSMLPEPIVIQWVDEHNKQDMRDAASFGVSTHLVRSPGLHELDQTTGAEVFQSMLGIVSEGIVDYNCDDATIASFGFDNPYLQADFTIQNGKDADIEEFHIKVVKRDDESLIMTCNENRVIYKILDVAFTKIAYEDFVMRWFLTPFITDLEEMKVTTPDSKMGFQFTGNSNKELAVYLDGQAVDIELFRSYYRLITSACNDGGPKTKVTPKGEPLFTVEFDYKDQLKPNDIMKIYKDDARTVIVNVNGKTEFTMKSTYIDRVLQGSNNIKAGTPIEENW